MKNLKITSLFIFMSIMSAALIGSDSDSDLKLVERTSKITKVELNFLQNCDATGELYKQDGFKILTADNPEECAKQFKPTPCLNVLMSVIRRSTNDPAIYLFDKGLQN
jgi:hypothetical protein